MDLEKVKSKLKSYKKEDIIFNEPHFTEMLILREGSREDVTKNLLNPEKLVHAEEEKPSKYKLYFKMSNTRTMILPIIFDKDNKKCLYTLTYIMRYRNWRNTIR